jgi:hypothetical protein
LPRGDLRLGREVDRLASGLAKVWFCPRGDLRFGREVDRLAAGLAKSVVFAAR